MCSVFPVPALPFFLSTVLLWIYRLFTVQAAKTSDITAAAPTAGDRYTPTLLTYVHIFVVGTPYNNRYPNVWWGGEKGFYAKCYITPLLLPTFLLHTGFLIYCVDTNET